MTLAQPSTPVDLPRDALHRIKGPLRVRCESGTLWITVDGLGEDIVLEAGEARCFAAGERLLVYALGGAATMRVGPVAAGREAFRLPTWPRLQRWLAAAATPARV